MLKDILSPEDLKKLKIKDLDSLSEEIRERIVDVISKNGGHLASSLGVVELTVALHYVFIAPIDKIIWDVGHQSYAHKILTGRNDRFETIRKMGGISGFPKQSESPYDPYDVGHSSTSLSLAIGEAVSRDIQKKDHEVVAIIGDGSLTSGMAFEALNQIGHLKNNLIIILNDNDHSISENVGGLSKYLTTLISGHAYNRFRKKSMELTKKIPKIGDRLYDRLYRFFASFKGILVPGQLFEDLGLRYFGPVDGHDINGLVELLSKVKDINNQAKIIHIITKKGKGYKPAEDKPSKFHGTGPFDVATGGALSKSKFLSYSEVAGKTLACLSQKDKSVMAITAAMKLGTGLYEFEKAAPDRFYDVGIAEQHAITFAASLACSGMKPFVSIYSTFLQRSIDQLIHDVGIMNAPVKILIDRAGIVGDDGETHHGLFDISIIKNIPNFVFLAPSTGEELRDMLHYALGYNDGPVAIRFPRGRIDSETFHADQCSIFEPGKLKILSKGDDCAIFTLGDMTKTAMDARDLLKEKGFNITVVNLLTIKPLDIKNIERIIKRSRFFITLENGYIAGGIGEYINNAISPDIREKCLETMGFPDEFIHHGSVDELFRAYKLDAESISKRLLKELKKK